MRRQLLPALLMVVVFTVLLGILVFLQQHVWPWMIPPH